MGKSEIFSLINHHDSLGPIAPDQQSHTLAPVMAATAVASPASMYPHPSGPPPPYSGSAWSAPTTHTTSSLASPPESRRASENKNEPATSLQTAQPPRPSLPSLPSISEALAPKSNGPYASPVSASLPPHPHSALSQTHHPAISRPYAAPDHAPYAPHVPPSQSRQASPPQPIHPQPIPFSRPEQPPSGFTNGPHHPSIKSLQNAPATPNSYDARPRFDLPRFGQEHQGPERMTNSFNALVTQPQLHGSYGHGPTPNHASNPHSPSYFARGAPQEGRANIIPVTDRGATVQRQDMQRNLQTFSYEGQLSKISSSCLKIHKWSENYYNIAQEQPYNTRLERIPSVEDCNVMLQEQESLRIDLERLREFVAAQHEHNHYRMRDNAVQGSDYYDDDVPMYGDGIKNQGYGGPENKKRRGRAAPPGRCHSCNRAETPEWRRGPDGARTLCNACGLHYAKLTRKNTMKQQSNGSSLRPKSVEDVPSRMSGNMNI